MSDGAVDGGTNIDTGSTTNDGVPAEPVVEVGAAPAEPVPPVVSESTSDPIPPAQASPASTHGGQAPAPSVSISIKDRAYAALEKIRFNKRRKLDKILQLARTKGRIKNDDVEKLLKVSDATVSRYLAQLVKEERLRRPGIRGGAEYEPI